MRDEVMFCAEVNIDILRWRDGLRSTLCPW